MYKPLIDQLRDPQPEKRIEALCALVMLQETDALDLLTKMWNVEQHAEVKQAVGWAGKQLQAAKQQGYSTAKAMVETFRLHLKPDEKEEEERRKLEQIQTNVRLQQFKDTGMSEEDRQAGATTRNALLNTAASIGLGFGAMGAINAMSPGAGLASSNIDDPNKPRIGLQPIIPAKPSTTDIQMWLKKLTAPDAKTKQNAIIQLRDFNNPAALAALGSVYVKDPDPAIKQVAQQTGKQIYFSVLYWQNPPQN